MDHLEDKDNKLRIPLTLLVKLIVICQWTLLTHRTQSSSRWDQSVINAYSSKHGDKCWSFSMCWQSHLQTAKGVSFHNMGKYIQRTVTPNFHIKRLALRSRYTSILVSSCISTASASVRPRGSTALRCGEGTLQFYFSATTPPRYSPHRKHTRHIVNATLRQSCIWTVHIILRTL